jgi:hypothetical protein
VILLRVRFPPVLTTKILKRLLPLMVSELAPGPVIVRVPAVAVEAI